MPRNQGVIYAASSVLSGLKGIIDNVHSLEMLEPDLASSDEWSKIIAYLNWVEEDFETVVDELKDKEASHAQRNS